MYRYCKSTDSMSVYIYLYIYLSGRNYFLILLRTLLLYYAVCYFYHVMPVLYKKVDEAQDLPSHPHVNPGDRTAWINRRV